MSAAGEDSADRPIFIEFIQRKGDDGFGESNSRALFEPTDEDQICHGF
jgi:4-hydroxyphenylpyruvate dioxygenase